MRYVLNVFEFCSASYLNSVLIVLLGIGFSLIAKATSAPSSRFSPEFYISVISTQCKYICLLIAVSSLFFLIKEDVFKADQNFKTRVRVSTAANFGGYDNIRAMKDTMNDFNIDLTNPYSTADSAKGIVVNISEKERVALNEFY